VPGGSRVERCPVARTQCCRRIFLPKGDKNECSARRRCAVRHCAGMGQCAPGPRAGCLGSASPHGGHRARQRRPALQRSRCEASCCWRSGAQCLRAPSVAGNTPVHRCDCDRAAGAVGGPCSVQRRSDGTRSARAQDRRSGPGGHACIWRDRSGRRRWQPTAGHLVHLRSGGARAHGDRAHLHHRCDPVTSGALAGTPVFRPRGRRRGL
jgi:hypothetical protein